MKTWLPICIVLTILCDEHTRAHDLVVSTTAQFEDALAAAAAGDRILLAPGRYQGGQFRHGLTGVTIRSQDVANRAVVHGGVNNIQLSDAHDIVIEHLFFEGATGNGLNIDDGGSFATPSTNVIIRDIVVRNVGPAGNRDGIKLSGVIGFLIERVQVIDWGDGGSAIDPVGSHNGLIQNSLFRHQAGGAAITGVRPKGGSKNVTIRANRIELPAGTGRAIQAGGSTGSQYFRFIDGDAGYEADNIVAEGNVILGAGAALAYVNIDGGEFHHNYIHRPQSWAFRILNENPGDTIVDTQNGVLADNIIVFNDTHDEWKQAGNFDGPEVLPQTFAFARNKWFNQADPSPAGSTPVLPVVEQDGTYGMDPHINPDEPIVWTFPWGAWVVNASAHVGHIDLHGLPALLATAGTGGKFDPRADVPLSGDWTFTQPVAPQLELPPFSQSILLEPAACPACTPLRGDYSGDGVVGPEDFVVWKQYFGKTTGAPADGNFNGVVDGADYTLWRDHLGSRYFPPPAQHPSTIPEPAAHLLLSAGMAIAGLRTCCLDPR